LQLKPRTANRRLPNEPLVTSAIEKRSPPIAELSGVYLAFVSRGARNARLALDNINLSIAPGEFCTIVGPSGCGKSTILNLLAGLVAPTEGDVLWHGRPVDGVNTSVGYVTQDDNLLPWRTLQQNVELALEFRRVAAAERRQRARELIHRVGLASYENHYPAELSGGMRKRASIIRTLSYDADMILMDEPFGPLDAQTRVILQNDLLSLWETSRPAVLFVTHDLVEAIALSDRIVIMSASPGHIKGAYRVDIPRPRDVSHPRGARFRRYLRSAVGRYSRRDRASSCCE
jgi:NitT/TauT family transport system ATP-binding protein